MKTKYQWQDSGLKQRAKLCQWGMLILGFVGIVGFFKSYIPLVIVVLVLMLLTNIYATNLRKQDGKNGR